MAGEFVVANGIRVGGMAGRGHALEKRVRSKPSFSVHFQELFVPTVLATILADNVWMWWSTGKKALLQSVAILHDTQMRNH